MWSYRPWAKYGNAWCSARLGQPRPGSRAYVATALESRRGCGVPWGWVMGLIGGGGRGAYAAFASCWSDLGPQVFGMEKRRGWLCQTQGRRWARPEGRERGKGERKEGKGVTATKWGQHWFSVGSGNCPNLVVCHVDSLMPSCSWYTRSGSHTRVAS